MNYVNQISGYVNNVLVKLNENKILRISRVYTDSVSISMVPYEIRKQFTA